MNKKNLIFVLITTIFIICPLFVNAFTAPIYDVEIKIKNLDTTNYIVDIFEYDSTGNRYDSSVNYKSNDLTVEQINKLHKLNFDGWISKTTRNWGIVYSECIGNEKYINKFSIELLSITNPYKIVIINNDTNDVKISKEIRLSDYEYDITIDYKTMNIKNKNIFNIFLMLVLTVAIEIFIAYIFKMGKYKIITCTNIILNLLFGVLLLKNKYLEFPFIIFGELIIALIISKIITYKIIFRKISNVNILSYTFFANMITIILSFVLLF